MCYSENMKAERKNYNTTLRIDLIRSLKILAAKKDLRVNDILEEAIQDVLKKYEGKAQQYHKSYKQVEAKHRSADGTPKRRIKFQPAEKKDSIQKIKE